MSVAVVLSLLTVSSNHICFLHLMNMIIVMVMFAENIEKQVCKIEQNVTEVMLHICITNMALGNIQNQHQHTDN